MTLELSEPIVPGQTRVRWSNRRGLVIGVENGGGEQRARGAAVLVVRALDNGRHVRFYVTDPRLEREVPR